MSNVLTDHKSVKMLVKNDFSQLQFSRNYFRYFFSKIESSCLMCKFKVITNENKSYARFSPIPAMTYTKSIGKRGPYIT